MPLLHELRRRKVFRVGAVYAVVGWLLIQVTDTVLPRLAVPSWVVTAIIALVLLGFPIAIVLAWAFEVTPDGVKRTEPDAAAPSSTSRRSVLIAGLVVVGLVVAGAYSLLARRGGEPRERASVASIAVLPFVDMSPEGDQRYFSHGLSEELLNLLAGIDGLRVASRTSSFQYDGASTDIRSVGRDLGVETVLEGSVRKAGSRIRITAQLIDASSGYHLWSETYDREMTDVFAVQDEIGRAIVSALGFDEGQADTERYTDNVAAYELYLRGRYLGFEAREQAFVAGESSVLESIALFEQALALDSTYALAWAGIADAYAWFLADNLWAPVRAYPRARDAALRALALDPDLSEAHFSLSMVKRWFDWDFAGADESLLRALELDPDNAMAHYQRAALLAFAMGRPRDSIEAATRAIELDSARYFEGAQETIVRALTVLGEEETVLAPVRRAAESDPVAMQRLQVLLHAAGRIDEWRVLAQRAPETPPDPASRAWELGQYAVRRAWFGDRTSAERVLRSINERADTTYVSPDIQAAVHAALGRPDSAMAYLTRAYEVRSALLADGYLDDAAFLSLRADPRFIALRRRVGLPPLN